MDLPMLDFDESTCFAPSDPEAKQKVYGSDWRGVKMAKTEGYSSALANKQMLRSNNSSSEGQMLSFSLSDSKSEGFDLYSNASSDYCTNTGYGSRGGMNGVRGPFTASQWMELEHQALIYKYIIANIPVPSNLLFPIQRALNLLRPNAYGWAGFHFGFSGNTDPEPGRCRRTDGKKWRCSRDAVPDQKYCERHINRGRHRSRKPVEGHNGPTTTATTAAATSAKASAAVTGGGGSSGLGMSHQSLRSCSALNINGIFLNKNNTVEKNQSATNLSMFSSGNNSKTNQFPLEKHENQSQFGLVSFDSLINPIQETPSKALNNRETLFQSSVHHQFIDEWPQNTEERATSPLRLSSKKADWVPISWEGPLGEVLHNTNQANSNEIKPFSGLNLMTGLVVSPNGPFQRTAFGSQSNSSTGSSPRGTATSLAPLL